MYSSEAKAKVLVTWSIHYTLARTNNCEWSLLVTVIWGDFHSCVPLFMRDCLLDTHLTEMIIGHGEESERPSWSIVMDSTHQRDN